MTEKRQGPTLGVHLRVVSIFNIVVPIKRELTVLVDFVYSVNWSFVRCHE